MSSHSDDLDFFAGLSAEPQIFVTDKSAEADRVSSLLRRQGYGVVDVPLSLLPARVAIQRPRLLLIDIDAPGAEGAVDAALAICNEDAGGAIDVVALGKPGGAITTRAKELLPRTVGFFFRPLHIEALLRKVAELIGEPGRALSTLAPSTQFAPFRRDGSGTSAELDSGSDPPLEDVLSPAPTDAPPSARGNAFASTFSASSLSPEVEQLLRSAENRLDASFGTKSQPPSPDEEVEAVLPAELLLALDEPIDLIDDELDSEAGTGTSPSQSHSQAQVNAKSAHLTAGGVTPAHLTPAMVEPEPQTQPELAAALPSNAPTIAPRSIGAVVSALAPSPPLSRPIPVTAIPPHPASAPSAERGRSPVEAIADLTSSPLLDLPGTLTPTGAFSACVARRATGALCVETGRGVRRIVLRDGDVVTAASGLDEESMLAFLVMRGDIPQAEAERLSGMLPAFGRHAGAALIARGFLVQDQLWPVLRAHAEWVIGCLLLNAQGEATFDREPPGRLKAEPSVFGGATGAEVFIDAVRRITEPAPALARIGGYERVLIEGPAANLLGECALSDAERGWMRESRGMRLRDALAGGDETLLLPLVCALVELGVLKADPASTGAEVGTGDSGNLEESSPLREEDEKGDEDALRGQVRARMRLVDEGDYFSLLGIARGATSYEVQRAYAELRRNFEPSRRLSPTTMDLADDLRLIVQLLDEAYDILRDPTRRDRYRRAIDAAPGGRRG